MVGGALAVLTCTFLAATFLTVEAGRGDDRGLAEGCRRRALGAGVACGAVALLGVLPLRSDAPTLFDGLTGRALPLIALSAVAGGAALWALWRRHDGIARWSAVVAVGSVVLGWGVAQWPWLLVDEVRIVDGAGARATLWALVVVFGLAAVTVLPALGYLYVLTQRDLLGGPGADAQPTAPTTAA
jgi:cytochrome d ubiquinol oxidase subunit II